MWAIEHLPLLTILFAVATVAIASGGFYLSTMFPGHRAAGQVLTVTIVIAIAVIFSVSIGQLWGAKRDRDHRVWTARSQHQERLRALLRGESASLKDIAHALREGRYFTLVTDDARKAVWQDDALTADVERHFPEYFREREELIRQVLQYDSELGRIRQIVSAALQLGEQTEPYRSELVPALVNKCAGASPGASFVRLANGSSRLGSAGRDADSGRVDPVVATGDAVRTYQEYRCTADLTRMCLSVRERAGDLADAASLASEAARRYAEETELRGSCTYAPAQ